MIMSSLEGDVSEARRATAAFLTAQCPWVEADAVVLVVSELVTNAIRHTTGWWRLSVRVRRNCLVVDLDDSSTTAPTARPGDLAGAGGHGWHIVRRLAADVEVLGRTCGKTVRVSWPIGAAPDTRG